MTLRYWAALGLTLALAAFLSYSTYRTAALLKQWRPPGNPLLYPLENAVRLALIALCVGLGILSGLPPAQLGWTTTGVVPALGTGALWGAALALLLYYATEWLVRGGSRGYSPLIAELIAPRSRRELALVALAMLPTVALEELLFRSLLLGGLAVLLPPWPLVLVLGVWFGLLHQPQGPLGMLGAGLAGIFLSWLFLHTGSLWTPLAAHYIANMAQLFVVMRRPPAYPAATSSGSGFTDGPS